MTIKIVNIRTYKGDDVAYIGRGSVLENIWSSKPSKYKHVIRVKTPDIAIENFKKNIYHKIKIKDEIIVNELKLLLAFYEENGTLALGCFCKDESEHDNDLFECEDFYDSTIKCHGDIVRDIILAMKRLKDAKSK